jgi:predicted alpha/beta-fold hydrolase
MSERLFESTAALATSAMPFAPPRWLTNAHLQSILPSLKLRRPLLARRARDLIAASATEIVECGDGVRLLGHHSTQTALGRPPARDLAILLHGCVSAQLSRSRTEPSSQSRNLSFLPPR